MVVGVVACSIPASAGDKNKEGPEVKFTSRTELVLIPTLVTDKSGAHVGGLKKEDFAVFENGSPRQIATFEEITSDPHRLTRTVKPDELTLRRANTTHCGARRPEWAYWIGGRASQGGVRGSRRLEVR